MLELVRSISHGKGINVIICSHLLPDIERTADQIIVITRGTLRAHGLIKDLKRIEGQPVDVELRDASEPWAQAVEALGAKLLEHWGTTYRIQAPGLPEDVARLALEAASSSGAQVRGFHVAERTLEDAFLEAVR